MVLFLCSIFISSLSFSPLVSFMSFILSLFLNFLFLYIYFTISIFFLPSVSYVTLFFCFLFSFSPPFFSCSIPFIVLCYFLPFIVWPHKTKEHQLTKPFSTLYHNHNLPVTLPTSSLKSAQQPETPWSLVCAHEIMDSGLGGGAISTGGCNQDLHFFSSFCVWRSSPLPLPSPASCPFKVSIASTVAASFVPNFSVSFYVFAVFSFLSVRFLLEFFVLLLHLLF